MGSNATCFYSICTGIFLKIRIYMSKKKKKYYAVVKGRKTGIYNKWYGDDGAAAQIENFSGSIYKGFNSLEDAKIWFKELSD